MLLNFLKNAGTKLFNKVTGRDDAEAKEAPKAEPSIIPDSMKATMLKTYLENMKLNISELSVEVNGNNVTLFGVADTQADKEKASLTAGNIDGVEHVDNQMRVTREELARTQDNFYTVKAGDSLSKISKQVYGDPMRYNEIFEANKPMLESVDLIYPGQVLRIP